MIHGRETIGVWALLLAAGVGAAACSNVGVPAGGLPGQIGDLPVDGTIVLGGLDEPVDLITDDHGVKHLYAESLEALFHAQGWVTASQRFFMMDVLRRFASGRLSELFGSFTLATDVEMRTVFTTRDGRRLGDALWERTQRDDPRAARITEAFVAGVNAWLDDLRAGRNGATLPPEYGFAIIGHSAADLAGFTPADVMTLGRLQAWNLSESVFGEIENARRAARLPAALRADVFRARPAATAVISPESDAGEGAALAASGAAPAGVAPGVVDPATLDAVAAMLESLRAMYPLGTEAQGLGSNNWVVSGRLTESGHAIMANDPHLQLYNPPIWHMVHLVAFGEDEIDVNGVIFPGLPGVILGHNRTGAWGATTSGWDVTDVYVEQITTPADYPAAPRTVLFRGQQVAVQRIVEPFRINRGETVSVPIEIVPHHGPMVPDPDLDDDIEGLESTGMSFRWTGHEITLDSRFLLGMGLARNADEFRAALRDFGTGGQNWVWADIHGDISWSPFVLVPERPAGVIPWLPVPGSGEAEWLADERGETRWVPYERLPQALNPERGWIASANNDPTGTTLDNDPLNDGLYLGPDFAMGFRAERIHDLLSGRAGLHDPAAGLTLGDMARFQYDHQSHEAARLLPHLFAAAEARPELIDGAMADALARLREWGTARPGSAPGAVAWDMVAGVDLAEVRDDVTAQSVSAEELRDSIATSIYVGWSSRLARLTLADDFDGTGIGSPGGEDATKALLHLLEDVGRGDAVRRIHTAGPGGESTLWDDRATAESETRAITLLRALRAGLDMLATETGSADPAEWRWGTIHAARFQHFFGQGGIPSFDIYPFPASGGRDTVNPGSYSLNSSRYNFAGGPSMRHVVVLDPAGVRSINILPGGNNGNPGGEVAENFGRIRPDVDYGTHIPGWIRGDVLEMRFTADEVSRNARSRQTLGPAS